MSTLTQDPLLSPAFSQAEQRTILRNIRWQTYVDLLEDSRDRSAPRLTFAAGTLEIIVPSADHEECVAAIKAMVQVLAEEWDIDYRDLGSTTFRRDDLERGFEPDISLYVQSVDAVRESPEIDLLVDPAPDVVVEVDISHPSLEKLPIFARIGVPEVWRYTGGSLHVLILADGDYREQPMSRAFPRLDADTINGFLLSSRGARRPVWLRHIREWAQSGRSDA